MSSRWFANNPDQPADLLEVALGRVEHRVADRRQPA
jgi:hypothetical protein